MSGLDDGQRTALSRLVVSARGILFADAEKALRGRYGILPDGTIQGEAGLASEPALRACRRTLEAVVTYLRADGTSAKSAVERLMREVAFTHLNRLLAIRVADALGILAPSLRDGRQSAGFRQWIGDLAPLLATADDTGGYWMYLSQCADELAVDAPALFDPRNPLLALRPSKAAFDSVVELLSDPENADLWDADDTFGWAYQFFNTREERQEMRKSGAPRDSRELSVRNQFFTPDYVVRFLVHNTLGRRLVDADPSTPLLEHLSLLIDPPTTRGAPVDLLQVKVLDPACGSGHFLLGCYDVLEAAWALAAVPPAEAAARIVPCLWGVDIDPRAVQVAQAAVIFRARRSCGRLPLPPPNVVCARALPEDPTAWDHAQEGLSDDLRRLLKAMRVALSDAPVLGPLLKAEQRLGTEIRSTIIGASDAGDDLFSTAGIAHDAFGSAERTVIAALQRAADATSATPAERLLAAGASDAVRFVETVRNRYDAVLMNPPFGEPVPSTIEYLKAVYSSTWTELYAAFIQRGLDLAEDHGYVGAITSSQYFSTRTLREFRRYLIQTHRPSLIIDLGAGVLDDATVSTAITVIRANRTKEWPPTTYRDLSHTPRVNLATGLSDTRNAYRAVDISAFSHIDGLPFALHLPNTILARWTKSIRLEPDVAIVRTGNHTFDDFRFLRLRWEVDPPAIGVDWRPFQKGGPYRPYFGTSHLVLDWRKDGQSVKESAIAGVGTIAQVMQSSAHWGKTGLTYSHVSSIGFAVRVLPAGEIFSTEAISIFPKDRINRIALLALLNSTVVAEILDGFGRSRKFENGWVKSLPLGEKEILGMEPALQDAEDLIRTFQTIESADETSSGFVCPFVQGRSWSSANAWLATVRGRALEAQSAIDAAAQTAMGISGRLDGDVPDRVQLLDRALPQPWTRRRWAQSIVSYLVGCAFGRWDIRVGREPSTAATLPGAFTQVSCHPPGLLLHDGGGALVAPRGYPIDLPPDGILGDELGDKWDLAERVRLVAEYLFEPAKSAIDDLDQMLQANSLRQYLDGQFFRDHLALYSKSRRQAPVYWQLTIPSGSWSAWLYAPRFSREMLYAAVALADRRIYKSAEQIHVLQEESGGSDRQRAKAVDQERVIAGELKDLRNDVARLAELGWRPNLEDGFILCAAPLSKWFPRNTWRQLDEQLASIKKGEYPWATVHAFRNAV